MFHFILLHIVQVCCRRRSSFRIITFLGRKLSLSPNTELTTLEVELVAGGIRKEWINFICNSVDTAHNMNKDLCIICGGEIMVHVKGTGVGGKNMEAALAAAVHMQELFREKDMSVSETRMCFLCCDSDGHDGITKVILHC